MKKLLALFLCAVMMVSFVSVSASAVHRIEAGDYGDVNGDAKINLHDVLLIMKYIAGWDMSEVRTFLFDSADVTHDDKLNLADVSKLLKHIAGWGNLPLGSEETE